MKDNYDDDEYKDFIEKFKKFFKIDSDIFDIDFLFMPESIRDPDFDPRKTDIKGFKVSYHFEKGMDEPEIRIEGDVDEDKIKDYLKRMNIRNIPNIKRRIKRVSRNKEIDFGSLSLEPCNDDRECPIEPRTEINEYEDHVEILLEVPGIEKGHVILTLSPDGKEAKIFAENSIRSFEKKVRLPFKSSLDDHNLEVNNGIATIIFRKIKIN
jgi:HSP20 family molecular chaperone IbpA